MRAQARVVHRLRRLFEDFRRLRFVAGLTADRASLRNFRRAERGRFGPVGEPVRVRVRALDGAEVLLRPGTSDAQMLLETFRDRVHEPPPEAAARGIRHIVDLGANLGITVAHNALRFGTARIVAVELDPENAELCRRNIAPWADRVELLQGAVWTEDGEVTYVRESGNEYGFYVSAGEAASDSTRAFSMDTILARLPADVRVDWMKMDIEGVEARLLSGPAASWAERVDAIGLQVHDPYSLDDCARDLRALGFNPRVDQRRPDFIVGVRA